MSRCATLFHLTALLALFLTHVDLARADPMPGLRRALQTIAALEKARPAIAARAINRRQTS